MIIDEIYQNSSVLLDNLWDFLFIPKSGESNDSTLKFKVVDINLPTRKYTVDTHNTGAKYYTGFTPEDEFTITFREDAMLNVISFLRGWEAEFYDDENKTFISMPRGTKRGSNNDKIHKDGVLTISKFVKAFKSLEVIFEQVVFPIPIKYTPQIVDRIRNVAGLFGKEINPIPPPHAKRVAATAKPIYVDLKETVKFTFKNMKYLGIDPIDFNYDTGQPLTYSATFVCDGIEIELIPTSANMDSKDTSSISYY